MYIKLTRWMSGICLIIYTHTAELIVGNVGRIHNLRTVRRERGKTRHGALRGSKIQFAAGEEFGGVATGVALKVQAWSVPVEHVMLERSGVPDYDDRFDLACNFQQPIDALQRQTMRASARKCS